MAYRTRSKMGVEILRTEGDLNAAEMVKIKDRLSRLMSKNTKNLVLDMSSARRVDLAGVGILVDRLLKVRAQNGDIKLCNIRPEVAKTFNMIGVGSLMQSFGSEAEALQSFAA